MIKLADVHALMGVECNYYLQGRWALLYDWSGTKIPGCVMLVLPYSRVVPGRIPATPAEREMFEKWAGPGVEPVRVVVDRPTSPWHRADDVRAIRYARHRGLRGTFRHVFRPPQPLLLAEGGLAIVLPGDCVIDRRGIVRP